ISNFCRPVPNRTVTWLSFHHGFRSDRSKSMRAALYTRVSTKDKEKSEDGQIKKPWQTTANQLQQLRDFATSQDWTIVQEYEDHDSGSRADRTQFLNMMRDAA